MIQTINGNPRLEWIKSRKRYESEKQTLVIDPDPENGFVSSQGYFLGAMIKGRMVLSTYNFTDITGRHRAAVRAALEKIGITVAHEIYTRHRPDEDVLIKCHNEMVRNMIHAYGNMLEVVNMYATAPDQVIATGVAGLSECIDERTKRLNDFRKAFGIKPGITPINAL
jgi:hypothetical protein